MKKLNRKGFTLVELLAVIVILGIVMLIGVTAVGPLISNTKKNSLRSELDLLVQAAQNKLLSDGKLEGSGCLVYDGEEKNGELYGFFDKKDDKYKGSVSYEILDGAITIKGAWITNGTSYFKTTTNSEGADEVTDSDSNDYKYVANCGESSGS